MRNEKIRYVNIGKLNPQKIYSIDRIEMDRGIIQFAEESIPNELLAKTMISEKTSYYLKRINQEIANAYRPSLSSTLLAILSLLTMTISDYYIPRESSNLVRTLSHFCVSLDPPSNLTMSIPSPKQILR